MDMGRDDFDKLIARLSTADSHIGAALLALGGSSVAYAIGSDELGDGGVICGCKMLRECSRQLSTIADEFMERSQLTQQQVTQ
jgi:hypothetical protein